VEKLLEQITANCKKSVRYLTNKINHTLHSKNDICSMEDFRGADIRLMSE
jgi:TRAP-type C4-dicarboxylate transport system substrate-binding protein